MTPPKHHKSDAFVTFIIAVAVCAIITFYVVAGAYLMMSLSNYLNRH